MIKPAPHFHLITTGGTIDSYYSVDQCTAVCFEQSVLPKHLLENARLEQQGFLTTQLCMKDSREISHQERNEMVGVITASALQAVVLTHGSFTLFETARFIAAQRHQYKEKTIILTGALKPIEGFTYSDGLFNLGAAIMAAQYAAPGIYICINGCLFNPDDRETWH